MHPRTVADDAAWMRRALALAVRGWGRTAPNPMVGCVLVKDGQVVGEGWHTGFGRPHAEAEALAAAGPAARGATAYVTLEPCSHQGKTPACAEALKAAGVSRVVFAENDPNPKAAGGGAVLRAAGIEVTGGVEAAAARDVDPAFFHAHGPEGAARPFIALKLALSLDARIADGGGRSVWITGDESRAEVHRLRAGFDAVAVGAGTAAADDPLLTVRGPATPRVAPARVVFDRTLRLPLDSRLVRTAADAPVMAVCEPGAPPDRRSALEGAGVRVLAGEGLPGGLKALRDTGIRSMLVEGGAVLASAVLAAEVVDRMYLFYAPVLLGPLGMDPFAGLPSPALADAARWRRLETHTFGADTLLVLGRRGD